MSVFVSRTLRACALALTLPLLTGCANYIFNRFDIDGSNDSLSIDAKQRVILSTREGGRSRDRKIVCAEPSPDAFSVYAASVSGSAAVSVPTLIPGAAGNPATQGQAGQGSGGFAGASNESGASLAMRTQTIQLLRDGLYRACEAYMNGAIDQHQYNILLLNIDRLMVTLLGVDGIAGTRTVAPVVISAHAPAAKVTAKASDTTVDPENPPANMTTLNVGQVNVPPVGAAQSEAIANIILAVNSGSAVPSLCISLLASGELRIDNPGQHSVLRACDYLLQGAVRKPFKPTAPVSYKMSTNAADAQKGTPTFILDKSGNPVQVKQ